MKKIFQFSLIILTLFSLSTCSKTTTTSTVKGSLKIEFDHLVNGKELSFNQDYVNAAGETMRFNLFKYFVSNFSLVKSDGTIYTVPKDSCYFLIEEPADGANPVIILNNIPEGEYSEIRYIVGIDSLKNTAPLSERTGVLDPAVNGMYWAWNSGYIFLKVEGKSPAVLNNPNATADNFAYHIGLFGGYSSPTVNNIKKISLSKQGETAKVSTNIIPHYHITVDLLEIFKTPNTMSLATTPTIHVSPTAKLVADNYVDMFALDHIHN